MPFAQPCHQSGNRPFFDDTRGHDESDRPEYILDELSRGPHSQGNKKKSGISFPLVPRFLPEPPFYPDTSWIISEAGGRDVRRFVAEESSRPRWNLHHSAGQQELFTRLGTGITSQAEQVHGPLARPSNDADGARKSARSQKAADDTSAADCCSRRHGGINLSGSWEAPVGPWLSRGGSWANPVGHLG
ncbi:hypothetical protein BKA56DRAFT_622182 [Ilyonectria sp. MPI-CAGE-AT-0026]|nr:hypothetical protein BKA56DRAFT_622182 [Ilyonectria sp. MPI-CAGE-AT-0026]